MTIQIDLSKCKNNNLTADEYIFLYDKKFNQFASLNLELNVDTEKLIRDGWVKEDPNSTTLIVRPKFFITFGLINDKVEDWIDEWRNLFPILKMNGYPVRGDKGGCLKKMKAFIRDNPGVTKDEIFEATKIYLFDKKKDNYKFIMLAHYFIGKNDTSALKAQIENLAERRSEYDKFKDSGSAFHKEV